MSHDEEQAGYCRPPKKYQFKKGHSGNPKGRPKGRKNIATILSHLLNATIPVELDGKKRKIPGSELVARGLLKKASRGDVKAVELAIKISERFTQELQKNSEPDLPFDPTLLTPEEAMTFRKLMKKATPTSRPVIEDD